MIRRANTIIPLGERKKKKRKIEERDSELTVTLGTVVVVEQEVEIFSQPVDLRMQLLDDRVPFRSVGQDGSVQLE